MSWTTPRTWVAGETVTAALLNTHLRDNLNAAFPLGPADSSFSTYTPQLTGSVSNPNMGTGPTQNGSYTQIGKLVTGWVTLIFGTGGSVAAGSGTYRISLPVTAATSGSFNVRIGQGDLFDSSASNTVLVRAYLNSSTTLAMFYPAAAPIGTLTTVTNSAPWTWATADELYLNFAYQAA